jgi:hypothetical protein
MTEPYYDRAEMRRRCRMLREKHESESIPCTMGLARLIYTSGRASPMVTHVIFIPTQDDHLAVKCEEGDAAGMMTL